MRMSETMPVPIVVENHDGLKLRTTLRQPNSYFDGRSSRPLLFDEGLASESTAGSEGKEEDLDLTRFNCSFLEAREMT